MKYHIGYRTYAACDGEETIRVYSDSKESSDPFDLVILDLTIPNSPGGEETVKRFNELNPNVKSIVSSGYSHESVMANYKAHGFNAVLAKPYKI